jgi:hypothetical protein
VVEVAAPANVRGSALRAVVNEVGWRALAGTAAGAVAGLLVGGVGGRLAMLLLRFTSPGTAVGLTSDDGFEIGVVSTSTFNLLFVTTALGGVVGALYAGVRGAVPERLRLPLWVVFWACVGGAGLVHDDGVDFTELEPGWLAVALFVVLPVAGAAAVVLLAERWSSPPQWRNRRLTAGLAVAAAASAPALIVALLVAAAMVVALLVLRRMPPRTASRARSVAGFVVPIVLVALAAVGLADLVPESARILD